MKLDIPFAQSLDAAAAHFPATSMRIGDIDVESVDMETARRVFVARVEARLFTKVGFLNAHCVNVAATSPDYRHALDEFTILPDGAGVDLAAWLLHGRSFAANLNGTDFVPYLLAKTRRSLRVGLLGAAPGIADRAAAVLSQAHPQHAFSVVSHGFFAEGPETEAVKAKLCGLRPDILLVALGVPNQELFMKEHLTEQHCVLAFGVGALLDFMAGAFPRAPAAARMLRLEWLFRLAMEPGRLWRRYVLGNPAFVARIVAERLRRRPAASAHWRAREASAPRPRRR